MIIHFHYHKLGLRMLLMMNMYNPLHQILLTVRLNSLMLYNLMETRSRTLEWEVDRKASLLYKLNKTIEVISFEILSFNH